MNVRRSAVVGNFAVEHNLTVRYLNHRRLAGGQCGCGPCRQHRAGRP